MGMYAPDPPKPRDYAQETRDTLQTQIDLAPDLYAAEASQDYGRPAYARLDLDVLRETMLGTADRPGLLELYERDVMPRLGAADAAARDVAREADIAAVERLGPRATEAFRASNPEQAALMDELNRQAMEELGSGASLPPSVARELEQSVRGAQAARGFGYGMADIGQEALVKGLQAEQLQRRRQQFGQQIAGLNMATTQDPFLAILGRPGVQINQAMGVAGQGQSFNPGSVFNPESAYAGSLFANNYNAEANARLAGAANRTAIMGSLIGAAGDAGGAMGAAAITACWVAREVYGVDNPKWLLFRRWMMTKAPAWFRNFYLRHGESIARWLRGKTAIKSVLRRWMDTKLQLA